jgi:GT2 family glycosyltransferase/glycosyltransferase involved in cell wall biosynthesis
MAGRAGAMKDWRSAMPPAGQGGFVLEPPSPLFRRTDPDGSRVDYERDQAQAAWREADLAQSAGQTHAARQWLERAYRFTPSDQNLAFALATARLVDADAVAALELFTLMASRHAVRELFAGQAAAALAARLPQEAAAHMARALSGFTLDAALAGLARACAGATAQDWCAVTGDGGVVLTGAGPVTLRLDGAVLDVAWRQTELGRQAALPASWRRAALPASWRQAARLDIRMAGREPLGSPVDLRAIHRVEGVVGRVAGGVAGWAWHPGAPETDPELRVTIGGEIITLTATDRDIEVQGTAPLTRPRGFRLALPDTETIRVLGRDGRDLLGSPLLRRGAAPAATARRRATREVSVVIPVYRGVQVTLDCIASVMSSIGPADRIVVVNDASPEPALARALAGLAASGAITLVASCGEDPSRNLGFPAAVNAGLRACAGGDVVLLNSDTVVYAGWLARLRAAAHALPDIGTATPLSNDATIFSYPDPASPGPPLSAAQGAALAAQAAAANDGILVEVPTGHGFCLYIRAACLRQTGLLREDVFGQGYGEENDFCQRARALGWRHVAVPGVYVTHRGGESFGPARDHLLRRNAALLDELHPDYHERVAAFLTADGLAASRRRIDAARWRDANPGAAPCVLLITHGGLGGTQRVVRQREAAARAQGELPVTITADGSRAVIAAPDNYPNLRFALPQEADLLADLLGGSRLVRAEIHHLLGHDGSILDLLHRFSLPYDVWIHDWSWICPRLSFITPEARYCGEPPVRDCLACAARGQPPAMGLSAADLRARSARLLAGAGSIITATQDGAARIARHFPGLAATIMPWETGAGRPVAAPWHTPGDVTVAVVGAIGVEKGYDVLLACARDAASRHLALRFAVIGYTIDDTPLLATRRVSVTGPFTATQATALIREAGARLAFLPSIWPETWCYALSDIWSAGLPVAVFDIGAPAERVRGAQAAGQRDHVGGWLLPLGLPPASVNDALLRLSGDAGRSAR